jgi:hypothetical protein
MTWSALRGLLLLVVTLVTGIAIGVWSGGSRVHGRADVDSGINAMNHEDVMQMLRRSLKLDSAQQRAVIATLHRHQSLVDSAWTALRPHVNETIEATHSEIMALLRPEQREAFRRLMTHAHGAPPP